MNFFRKITKSVGKTLGGAFEDITQPFLKPIDNLLDSINPFRFKFRADVNTNSSVNVRGGTRHEIIFPNFPIASGTHAPIFSDITGGLLSDLAFDSNEIRRSESELRFLSKAMRKGLYPHKNDAFFLRLRLVPAESLSADFHVELEFRDAHGIIAEAVVAISSAEVKNQFAVAKSRIATQQSGSHVDTEALRHATLIEETMSLPIPRGQSKEYTVLLKFRKYDGNPDDALAKQFSAISVSIERENESYSDVLHRVDVDQPKESFNARFFLDRKEYISTTTNHMAKLNLATTALVQPGRDLDEAADMLGQIGSKIAVPLPAGSNGSSAVFEYLLQRTRAAEGVRNKLFDARQSISRFQINEDTLDYRLRYKLRLENLSRTSFEIEEIKFINESKGGQGVSTNWELKDFELLAESEYETTLYPLMDYDDSISRLSVRIKATTPKVARIRMSLTTGIGAAEMVVRSRMLESIDENTIHQNFEWAIADTVN